MPETGRRSRFNDGMDSWNGTPPRSIHMPWSGLQIHLHLHSLSTQSISKKHTKSQQFWFNFLNSWRATYRNSWIRQQRPNFSCFSRKWRIRWKKLWIPVVRNWSNRRRTSKSIATASTGMPKTNCSENGWISSLSSSSNLHIQIFLVVEEDSLDGGWIGTSPYRQNGTVGCCPAFVLQQSRSQSIRISSQPMKKNGYSKFRPGYLNTRSIKTNKKKFRKKWENVVTLFSKSHLFQFNTFQCRKCYIWITKKQLWPWYLYTSFAQIIEQIVTSSVLTGSPWTKKRESWCIKDVEDLAWKVSYSATVQRRG